jgi:hypothetical protein
MRKLVRFERISDAHAHLGATARNIRNSWSARTPDGDVVVHVWTSPDPVAEFRDGRYTFTPTSEDRRKAGWGWLVADVTYALKHRRGRLIPILITKKDRRSPHIGSCAVPSFDMQVVQFDEEAGIFVAEVLAEAKTGAATRRGPR